MSTTEDNILEIQQGAIDSVALNFDTYEDYLDSQVTPLDLFYLDDENLARHLVELGYRGNGEKLSREDFEEKKAAANNVKKNKIKNAQQLVGEGKDLDDYPLLKLLAHYEESVKNGKTTMIVFIRDENKQGQEISGYIDYGNRLKNEDFSKYFDNPEKDKGPRLLPTPRDLSYYNWETQHSTSNSTANFQVLVENEKGLLFKNIRDRKIINPDPKANPGDNTRRIEITTDEYIQVVLFEHTTRRKN